MLKFSQTDKSGSVKFVILPFVSGTFFFNFQSSTSSSQPEYSLNFFLLKVMMWSIDEMSFCKGVYSLCLFPRQFFKVKGKTKNILYYFSLKNKNKNQAFSFCILNIFACSPPLSSIKCSVYAPRALEYFFLMVFSCLNHSQVPDTLSFSYQVTYLCKGGKLFF